MFDNVSKTYDNGTQALNDVSFSIEKGEFVYLVGQSGAGKSTLTKLIIREEVPTYGNILVNNYNVPALPRKKIPYLRRGIGMVFQDFRLLPNMTVYENVAFAMKIVGASNREIRRSVANALALVGLSHKAKEKPAQLSGGEQQRVSLARAMANNPPLLIADEPTANLDPHTSMEIMELLGDINNRGATILMATHNREIVNEMRRRVIEIDNGMLVRDEEKGAYAYENQ